MFCVILLNWIDYMKYFARMNFYETKFSVVKTD